MLHLLYVCVHVERTFALQCFLLTQLSIPTYTLSLSSFSLLIFNTCLCSNLTCLPVSLSMCIICTGNYRAFASDHSNFLFHLLFALLSQTNPALSLHLSCHFLGCCIIIILHQSNHLFVPSQSKRTNCLSSSSFLSALSEPAASPKRNITLYPSDKVFSSDHGPFPPFLSLIPASPSFVPSIFSALPSLS